MPFTNDPSAYGDTRALIERTFDLEQRLPQRVLRAPVKQTAFFEFDDVFEADFWFGVARIAQQVGETEIFGLVVDPDPGYFCEHFGYYGAMKVQIAELESEIPAILQSEPEGSPADSLVHNGRVVAFVGGTGQLAIWAERDPGIGLMASSRLPAGELVADPSGKLRSFSATSALELMAPSFATRQVPKDFRSTFLRNYDHAG